MRTGAAILGMLASAGIGAAAAGWVTSTHGAALNARGVSHVPVPMLPGNAPGGFPLGDIAGGAGYSGLIGMPNPLGEGPVVVEHGHRLFLEMNCAGCHGYHGKGGMGPDLTDHGWRYGGAPAQIYNSIAEGRPKGMPAWGRAMPPELIWELTAYVHTLGGGIPASRAAAGLQGDYRDGQTAASGVQGGPDRRGGGAGNGE